MFETKLNKKYLPDTLQAREVAHKMWLKIQEEKDQYNQETETYTFKKVHMCDECENSSTVTGIRSIRPRFWCWDLAVCETLIADLKALADQLPTGCYHYFVVKSWDYDHQCIRKQGFCVTFKIFYRSNPIGKNVGPTPGVKMFSSNFCNKRNHPLYKDHPQLQDPEFVQEVIFWEQYTAHSDKRHKKLQKKMQELHDEFLKNHPKDWGYWVWSEEVYITSQEARRRQAAGEKI